MALNEVMEKYASDCQEDVKKFLRELAVIPAPSHHEELRVEYVKKWMEEQGCENVIVDKALNVIWPINVTEDNDLVVFMAHTDVVFPDTTPLPLIEKDGKYHCPGVGDDTANLATLLHTFLYFIKNNMTPKTGILLLANSCEEGLGNLKGSRCIIDTYGARVKQLITVDGNYDHMVTTAVGSHRYKVSVVTEGGHSYGAFGNRNAIHYLASMIDTLYTMKVPSKPGTKTTYNVGSIEGGTSVNTIAQSASMLYEYRSDDAECLAKMQKMFAAVIEAYKAMDIEVNVELLGERPCNGELDPDAFGALIGTIKKAAAETLGFEPREDSGSTDANYPLSKGVPAVCIGGSIAKGAHTREEWVDLASLKDGVRFLLEVVKNYFEV